jgi:hypothetical protein
LNRQNVLQRLNQQTGIVSDVPVLLNGPPEALG